MISSLDKIKLNGCEQCNESRPTCRRCERWELQCDYSAFRFLRSVSPPKTPSNTLTESAKKLERKPYNSSQPNTVPLKISYQEAAVCHGHESNALLPSGRHLSPSTKKLELHLLQAFVALNAPAQAKLASSAPGQPLSNILHWTTKYCYTRDIVLGCSALLHRTHNPDSLELISASRHYAERAITECARELRIGVREDNSESLLFASMFIAKHAFASRLYESGTWEELPLLRWLRQFRGIRSIMDAGSVWIQKNERLELMLSALPTSPITESGDHVFAYLLEDLEETDSSFGAYQTTVMYLTAVVNDSEFRGMLGFPIAVPDRLVELLEEKDPRAMAIIGSYLALSVLAPGSEVMKAAARREYGIVMGLLPAKWAARMKWAASVVNFPR